MHTTIAHLIDSYGYAVLFALVALESLGIPLPGETALVVAAASAALGHLSIPLVVATAATGAILGDNAGYWIGRTGGVALIRRYGRHVGLTEAKLDVAHAFFERHGAKTVFLARFLPLLRSWAAALAGAGRMSNGTFMLYNALGGVVWAGVFGTMGYVFGQNLPALEHHAGQASLALALLVALIAAVALAARWFAANREMVAARVSEWWQRAASDPRLASFRARHERLWTFIAARFARGEYLGLHLTVGLLISAGALWLFAGVTEDVVNREPLTLFDLQLAAWMHAHATAPGYRIAEIVSLMGSPPAMAALALVVAIALAARRRWIVLAGWVAAFAGGGLLDWTLKLVIHRPRPVGASAFLHGESFSFPSGHAMGSLIGFGMLAYVVAARLVDHRRARGAVSAVAVFVVLAIGGSRLYLGVHYFSDVVGGFAAGVVWLGVCISGVEIALRQRQLSPWQVGVERRRAPRASSPRGAPPVA